MQFFEVVFFLASLSLLTVLSFFNKRTVLQVRLFQIGLLAAVLHIVFELARWQMLFCFVTFLITSIFLLKRSTSHIVVRVLGFIVGLIFIITSGFYAWFMPVLELPAPEGDHAVGTTRFTIVDGNRPEKLTEDPGDRRELFIEVWYPASLDKVKDLPKPATLWQELTEGELDRVSFFVRYMSAIETHAYPNVPPALEGQPFPVILFNHGLQMFTAQNTLLMEHLASHGYIIVSIAHPYESLRVNLEVAGTVLPEFITSLAKFQEAMAWIEKTSAPVRKAQDSVRNISSLERRSEVMLDAIKESPLNDVVSYWELDNKFILKEILSPRIKKYVFGKVVDTTRIGIMGMSIGGATATELAKSDDHITAAINMDGLQYGNRNYDTLKVPFMMLYSQDGMGSNEFLYQKSIAAYYEYTIEGARHADLSDMTVVWPVMRIYGQLGTIPGERMSTIVNRVVLNFWDAYLKDRAFEVFSHEEFPELEIDDKRK